MSVLRRILARLAAFAAPAPEATEVGDLVPATLSDTENDEPLHRWDDRDIAIELRAARHLEVQAPGGECRLAARGRRATAAWHRRRARAIAGLIQAQDAALGWYHAEHLLCDRPTRLAPFAGGPFDASHCRIDAEPYAIRVAHRPRGEGLDGAFLVQEIRGSIDSTKLPMPTDAEIIGQYRWMDADERFDWIPGDTIDA